MQGLYAIVDTKLLAARGTDPIAYARALLEVRPAALQLRAKDVGAREMLAMLRALGSICRQMGVPLVTNDRADLAALAGCEAVHIGQEDLPYELVHRIAPQLSVGISTHNLAQLEKALAFKPRYVAYGPVFETTTKMNADPVVGLEGLRQASRVARAAGIPIVAIGGITLARVHELVELADACAVIGDLYLPGASLADVTERARAFQVAFGGPHRVAEARP
ncbi:MAG: Thiamin-phosphate pyrophosphorylase [Labilithrix sp.]|nr:Thiamin-phosphate pyrophosphorylase [Labilithrix sp.]